MGVAKTLLERQTQVGKFIPIVELPLPPKPPDIADNAEARKNYRRRARGLQHQCTSIQKVMSNKDDNECCGKFRGCREVLHSLVV